MWEEGEKDVCNYDLLDDPGQKVLVKKTGCRNQQFCTEKKKKKRMNVIVQIKQN